MQWPGGAAWAGRHMMSSRGWRETSGPGVQRIRKGVAGDRLGRWAVVRPCGALGSYGRFWKGSDLISFAFAKGHCCTVVKIGRWQSAGKEAKDVNFLNLVVVTEMDKSGPILEIFRR